MYYHGPYTKCNLLLLAIGGIECNPGPRPYSIVVWFGVSHLLHVHDTDVFERVLCIYVDIPIQAV
jgi:hypothetical protein